LLAEVPVFTAFGIAPGPPSGDKFRVHFRTDRFRPNHVVSIRNSIDGWERDIFGAYRDGQWLFDFERTLYPNGLEMKFVLDRKEWMDGFNQQLSQNQNHFFDENTVKFQNPGPLYRHGYDNLATEDGGLPQATIRRNCDPSVEYDVIVIGSGFGGGVLTDELTDRGLRTLVLEAGSLAYPSHITNLPGDWPALPARHQIGHFVNVQGSQFLFGVHMSLGGRSVFWSGLIPRMHAWELDSWPAQIRNYLGAGTGYDDAETLLRKQVNFGHFQSETINKLRLAFPNHNVTDLPRSRHQPDPGPNDPLANVLEKSTGTFSTADLLLDSLAYTGMAGRDNLTVNLNHLVVAIEHSGRKATGVVCLDLIANQERRYKAKRIVLAAGSLESARIAQRSQLSNPLGKIGSGLTDHPAFFSREYDLDPTNPFGGLNDHAKIFMSHKTATANTNPFNVEVLVNPKYWEVRHPDDDVRKERVDSVTRSSVRFQFVFASPLDDSNFVRDIGLWQKAEVKVNGNGSGASHFNTVRTLRNQLLTFFGVKGFDPNEGMHYGNEGTVHHAGGTLRMSGNGSGVVNEDLRFEEYDNLYACDASVFPMIPAANPALTISALALRLGKHLKTLS
jgi:choline dehydrogenase-like flavoprotein